MKTCAAALTLELSAGVRRLETGAVNPAATEETTKQDSSTVVKETIGTPDTDYARYSKITSDQPGSDGKPADFSSVEGIWGKSPDALAGETPQVQYFIQGMLGTVPFANLNAGQRSSLIQFMHSKNVYQVNFGDVKTEKSGGKTAYVYSVKISPVVYFEMLQEFVKDLGLPEVAGLNPAQYANIEPLEVTFTVTKNARQLTKINYINSQQDEFYSDYGLVNAVGIPSQTIPIDELQNRIQQLQ